MSNLGIWDILKSPIVTEKSVILKEESSEDSSNRKVGQVLTFRVDTKATKAE
ncbi:MAG: 50S ribosomal protein L23, partial [Blastocatellia bacterium]